MNVVGLRTHVHLEDDRIARARFRTGVSLHSHTLFSREPLAFVQRSTVRIAPARWALAWAEKRYREAGGQELDLSRAFWTPPLSPHDAWVLESNQIEKKLDLDALVSLTDHDSIDAAMSLRVLNMFRNLPISVEWTVPYRETFFHLGIHNLAAESARATMNGFAALTGSPDETRLRELLDGVTSNPATLVVLNHPCWDEKAIGQDRHMAIASGFCRQFKPFLHALELNGLRPWSENRQVVALAAAAGKPTISGGDRHGFEPNATLNLTNASTFAEFVAEVRHGRSDVLIMRHYFEPHSARMLRSIQDAVADHRHHGYGWTRWSDRVFYVCDDGEPRPLAQLWTSRPLALRLFEAGLRGLQLPGLQTACRVLAREQAAL